MIAHVCDGFQAPDGDYIYECPTCGRVVIRGEHIEVRVKGEWEARHVYPPIVPAGMEECKPEMGEGRIERHGDALSSEGSEGS